MKELENMHDILEMQTRYAAEAKIPHRKKSKRVKHKELFLGLRRLKTNA